jgi:hypothetical protein
MYCIKYINLSKFATLPDNFEENLTRAIYVLREEIRENGLGFESFCFGFLKWHDFMGFWVLHQTKDKPQIQNQVHHTCISIGYEYITW